VLTVHCQAHSLLGHLEGLGPGTAAGRRWQAEETERRWWQEERAYQLAHLQGFVAYRTGFAKTD
jgi:hypothetical protein